MRILIAVLWLIAIGLLVGAVRLPAAVDIYVKDRYFVISKQLLIALVLIGVMLPLLVVTVRRFR